MTLVATPLYAGLLALLFLVLSYRVVQGRFLHRVSIGDGGNKDLIKRMRVQANFVEYVPLAILLLALAELQGLPLWLVHLFGLMLLAGRLMHAYGLGSSPQVVSARQFGMYLTLGMMTLLALANIGTALS